MLQLDPQDEGPGGDNKKLLTFGMQLVHLFAPGCVHVRQVLSQGRQIFGL